jgi:hypothetical protein
MATWGPDSFDNDDAKEWAAAYREMGIFVAQSTMEVALGDFKTAGLRADVASRAVAAVEAVAFALGRGSAAGTEAFAGAPEANPSDAEALLPTTEEVLAAVTGGSELNTQWTEAGADEHAKWAAAIADLQARLSGVAAAPAGGAPAEASASQETVQSGADQAELLAAVEQLSNELQIVRKEMRAGMTELAKRIGALGE